MMNQTPGQFPDVTISCLGFLRDNKERPDLVLRRHTGRRASTLHDDVDLRGDASDWFSY